MTVGDHDYILEEQIGYVLRLSVQYHTNIFTRDMVKSLTQTQFAILAKLYEIEECSQSELGRKLELDSATVNGVVERMRSRGFIQTKKDTKDRRRQSLTLTETGLQAVSEARSAGKAITDRTLQNLTESERARLIQLLHKMMGKANRNT